MSERVASTLGGTTEVAPHALEAGAPPSWWWWALLSVGYGHIHLIILPPAHDLIY